MKINNIIPILLCSIFLVSSTCEAWDFDRHSKGWIEHDEATKVKVRKYFKKIKKVKKNKRAIKRHERFKKRRALDEISIDLQPVISDLTFGAGISFVDNSELPSFPPIRSQGSINSCVAFCIVYYQLTHEIGLLNGYDNKNNSNNSTKYSPKFIYNFLNSGMNAGTQFYDAYRILKESGAPSWLLWPYTGDYRSWPTTPQVWNDAINQKISDVSFFSVQSDVAASIQKIKDILANGHVLTFGTYVMSWNYKRTKDNPNSINDDPYINQQVCYYQRGMSGPHAMTVVGYNDDIWTDINNNGVIESQELGAFKIANQWGTGWRNSGYCWVAYDALYKISTLAGAPVDNARSCVFKDALYKLEISANYIPKVIAEFTTKHRSRDRLLAHIGISGINDSAPNQTFQQMVFSWPTGGPWAYNGGTNAVNGTFALDFSNLVTNTDIPKKYWLWVEDAKPYPREPNDWVLDYYDFKIIDKAKSVEVISTNESFTINNSGRYVTIIYPSGNQPPVIILQAIPNNGLVPLDVSFTANIIDPEGDNIVDYIWNFGE